MWMPSLVDRSGPKYLRIADAIAEDVYAGRLKVGERLPTHRDLAWRLGVTVGTVSRAYAEAERRGLVAGEVGRGSFVKAGARSQATLDMPAVGGPQTIELGVNRPPAHVIVDEFAKAMRRVADSNNLAELINYQAHTGRWEHRAAGAKWIRRRGVEVGPERVLVTSGAEHAITASLMAFSDPGDPILVEELTWSGVRALASLLRLSLRSVAMDEEGMIPEALEAVGRASGARLLYTTPTMHNPTTKTMSTERRRAIAEVCRDLGITIIEDDIYGYVAEDPPPALASFAPERSIYITAASKSMAPSLRIGFAAMPSDRIGRFSSAARATNWMAPPVMAQIVADWIEDGTCDVLADRIRRETKARQAVAARALEGLVWHTKPGCFHIWLELPEPWRAQDVVAAARQRGLAMTSTELFVPGRAETPHAMRITLTATADVDELDRGLRALVALLRSDPDMSLAAA
jgi:DNA-binding transcriptional MocR family regulator